MESIGTARTIKTFIAATQELIDVCAKQIETQLLSRKIHDRFIAMDQEYTCLGGDPVRLSLIQMAIEPHEVYVFHVHHMPSITGALKRLIVSDGYVRVGFGCVNDINVMKMTFGLTMSVIDLQHLSRLLSCPGNSLKDAVNHFCGYNLVKTIHGFELCDWRELDNTMIEYAARDALSCYNIWNVIRKRYVNGIGSDGISLTQLSLDDTTEPERVFREEPDFFTPQKQSISEPFFGSDEKKALALFRSNHQPNVQRKRKSVINQFANSLGVFNGLEARTMTKEAYSNVLMDRLIYWGYVRVIDPMTICLTEKE
jgi:hypothetical protein